MALNQPVVFSKRQTWFPGEFHVLVRRMERQGATHLHEHDFHEIAFVEAGTAEHVAADGVRKLHPGDVIVLQPRMWHQYQNPCLLTIINCLFDGALLAQYGAVLNLDGQAFDLFRRRVRQPRATAPVVLHATPAQRTLLRRNLDAMIFELHEKRGDWKAVVMVRLLDLLVAIGRLDVDGAKTQPVQLANRALEAVVEVANFIEDHYTEAIKLNALAQMTHVSPGYLSRTFSRRMGMGIIDYLHHIRIEEACRILRHTDEPISRVAMLVGYAEIAYFARRFRRDVGLCARQYRIRNRGDFNGSPSQIPFRKQACDVF